MYDFYGAVIERSAESSARNCNMWNLSCCKELRYFLHTNICSSRLLICFLHLIPLAFWSLFRECHIFAHLLKLTLHLFCRTLDNSRARGYIGSYEEYECGVGFETFGCSLLIVFQIVTTNDWQEIMLGANLNAGLFIMLK